MLKEFLTRLLVVCLALGGTALAAQSAQAQSPYNDPFFGRPASPSRPATINSPTAAPLVAPNNAQPAVAIADPSDQSGYDRPRYDRPNYDRPNYDRPNYDRPNYGARSAYDRPSGYDSADAPPPSGASGAPIGLGRAVSATTPTSTPATPERNDNYGDVPRGRITPYGVLPPTGSDGSPFAASGNAGTPQPQVSYPPIPKADVPKAPEAQFAQCAGNAADATTDSILAACSAIINAGRDNRMAEVYANRARAWHAASQYKAAVADFDQALRLKGDNAEALQGRCMSRAVLGDLQKALADCNQALKLQPDDMAALEARGFTYRKLRDFAQSLADYNAVLKREPKRATALFGRGATKLDNSDNDGYLDIKQAKELQSSVAQQYGRYGVYH